jgi:plasmid segregation protein ParM
MLNVKHQVANGIQERFDLESLSEPLVAHAVEHKVVRVQGKDHDVVELVEVAMREVVERIFAETRRQLGLGVELDRVLFVGGGTVALAAHIANWFPHQAFAENPAFANARGMLKYLRYVCEASDAA